MDTANTFRIEIRSLQAGAPRAYRVAGSLLVTDMNEPALPAYAVAGPVAWAGGSGPPPPDPEATVTFDGEGLIGNGYRHVVCRTAKMGYELWAEGMGAYTIDADGRIFETAAEPGVALEVRTATALGAPLILALALRGTFCIHASVAMWNGRLAAFIGESGAGKSTLARFLNLERGSEWRRIIDDTLPLATIDDGPAIALPHFPQLKLPDAMQPSRLVPERVPLSAVYVLENAEAVSIAPLRRSEAALALIAQTVGGRLFGRGLLAKHMTFCGELAGRVPVRRLAYPRTFDNLPTVREAVAADLSGEVFDSAIHRL